MIDSNETNAYENGRDVGYSEGYEDAVENMAKVISEECGKGGCPFNKDCDVYSDKECINRIIDCFKLRMSN